MRLAIFAIIIAMAVFVVMHSYFVMNTGDILALLGVSGLLIYIFSKR
jgi:uncharacterized membrane protein YcfT